MVSLVYSNSHDWWVWFRWWSECQLPYQSQLPLVQTPSHSRLRERETVIEVHCERGPTLAIDLAILVTDSGGVQFLATVGAVEAALVPALKRHQNHSLASPIRECAQLTLPAPTIFSAMYTAPPHLGQRSELPNFPPPPPPALPG